MADADAISILPLTQATSPDIVEGAFNVLCDVFVASSVVHYALDIEMDPYRSYYRPYFEAMVEEHLSLVAISTGATSSGATSSGATSSGATSSGVTSNGATDGGPQVAGVIMGCDFADPGEANAEYPSWIAPLYALLDELTRSYRSQNPVTAGEVVLVDMAAVPPHFGGRGIYKKLRMAFHESARAAGYRAVVAELSSAATQKVCVDRFGHTVINEIAFADFEFNGAHPFASIREPATIQLVEGSLA